MSQNIREKLISMEHLNQVIGIAYIKNQINDKIISY